MWTATATCIAAASAPSLGMTGIAVGALGASMVVAAGVAATGGLALAVLPLMFCL